MKLVGLADVLRSLAVDGPQTSRSIAERFNLHAFDARTLLLDAHASRLVYPTSRGEWALTQQGRRAAATDRGNTEQR